MSNTTAELLGSILVFGNIPNIENDASNNITLDTKLKARAIFDKRKYQNPLTLSILYETIENHTFNLINHRVDADPLKEVEWTIDFLKKYSYWLQNKEPKEIFRAKTYLGLIKSFNWQLSTPLQIHLRNGVEMTLETSIDGNN